ncbi:MAG TPA: hypothetical protein VJ781_10175 [Pyrinomonadaceae bacterium]|nr:hypothetical protein [Pyrinomonadaceae bacterium]
MKLLTIGALLTITTGSYFGTAEQDKSFTLKVEQEKVVPGTRIKVKFIELIEDSRCPTDVQCVWAGNAKIKLRFSKGSSEETVELNTFVKPKSVEFGGHSFTLMGLAPRPRSNVRISRLGYTAALAAKRL